MADYTNPNAPVVQNPINLDKQIGDIQTRLATIPWLETAYGRVWNITTKELIGKEKAEPHVYVANGQYKKIMANDNLKSESFVFVRQPERIIDYELNSKTQNKEVDISIIFWMDLRKINPTLDQVYTEILKSDIEAVLYAAPPITNINRVWDDEGKDIFKGFNIDNLNKELLMYPFKALRYDCQISYETLCE
jgi:hypothetical protein